MQVAVWEIVWENPSESYDLGSGDVSYSISNAIQGQAEAWLSSATDAGSSYTAMKGLVGLTSPVWSA